MKLFRFALSFWITLVSIGSFLMGWVALAHSPKPVQLSSSRPSISAPALPTLAPLPGLQSGDNNNGGFQSFSVPDNGFNNAPPVFSTGGS